MSLENFITVKIKIGNEVKTVKMEKGTSFENKSGIFEALENGQTLQMTNYQFNVFQAVANNYKENDQTGIILSKKDIDAAMKKYELGILGKDLSEFLRGGYKIHNPKAFKEENKISAYVTNGNSNTSAVICFQYRDEKVEQSKKEDNNAQNQLQTSPADGVLLSDNLFSNPNIIVNKSFSYKLKKGDTILSLAQEYELDTYQIVSANPQLKEGKDYTVTYRKNNTAIINSNLKEGQILTIPARYSVKAGKIRTLEDVCKITGLSSGYLKDLLTIIEVKSSHPGKPDLTTYDDGFGTPTIGYGHTGKFDGKRLSLKKKITITEAQALQLLAEDILKHEAMVMSYVGKDNYNKAPASVKSAILDIAYNKGIWDGFLNHYHNSLTSKVKSDLKNGYYASALCHTIRMNTPNRGLKRRNIYRFISGLSDLSPTKRESAIKETEGYYQGFLRSLKGLEKKYLQKAWENAKLGKTTGYKIHSTQTDR